MKILIINQHSWNHGDEAAGKALIRALQRSGNRDISVLYNMPFMPEDARFNLNKVCEIYNKRAIRGLHFFLRQYLKYVYPLGIFLPILLFPRLRKDMRAIQEADAVINAPGGVNLGPYFDVVYLWRLLMVIHFKKPLYIFSPSIGPLLPDGFFRKLSVKVLKYACFVSLRDAQSQRYAVEYGIPFIPAIDVVFSEREKTEIPIALSNLLPENYIVIVPNQLYTWHPAFFACSAKKMDEFYKKLIQRFTSRGIFVVLLPQLFSAASCRDEIYFKSLASGDERVIVIPDFYNSDVQQAVIRKSDFIVGARYHSIVFGINNFIPFFALSYEHKILNMLEVLNLKELSRNLAAALDDPSIFDEIWMVYQQRAFWKPNIEAAKRKATEIADNAFNELQKKLLASADLNL